jgi:hypothetical protein
MKSAASCVQPERSNWTRENGILSLLSFLAVCAGDANARTALATCDLWW